MGSTLVQLLPLIIGSAVVPMQIILIILMLTSEQQAAAKAIGFVLGMTLVRLGQGILFGLIFTGGADASGTTANEGSSWVVSTLLLVLGLLLLITAFKTWRGEPDPDAPPPKWLTMADEHVAAHGLCHGGRAAPDRRQALGLHAGRDQYHRRCPTRPAHEQYHLPALRLAGAIAAAHPDRDSAIFPEKSTAWLRPQATGWRSITA